MIGLVISRPAAVTVAGVTPLSFRFVWWIKASMHFQALTTTQQFLIGLLMVWSEIMVGVAVYMQSLALVPACLICAWSLFTCVRDTLRPRSHFAPQWRTAQLHGNWYWSDPYSTTNIPAEAAEIADRVRAIGLAPQVEYFDTDPFLFVDVLGKRIYLYHWS